jgi:glyoxylase-like metal-dependent hydrolase (beta-lactamase superfamily II)
MKNVMRFAALAAMLLVPAPAWAQAEIAGDWDQPTFTPGIAVGYHEETQDRGGGPDLGDYAGLPINGAARYKATLYSPSWLSVPEHQCLPHPATYQYRSPGNLSIVKVYDPVTQRLQAYQFFGSYGLARVVWMDGRSRPPENAPHTYNGFSLGRWDGDKLVVETTHLKYGFVRRNGVAHSDRVRMIEHFVRHDNVLTIVTAIEDPLYFDEPFVRSSDYRLDVNANQRLMEFGGFVDGGDGPVYYKCSPVDEVDVDRWLVPSYMPGSNTELDMFSKRHNVPMEAALGGAQTMYPEYMTRVRQLLAGTAAPAAVSAPPRVPERAATPAAAPGASAITSQHVGGQVWMVAAGGRNIAVQIGSEGVLVVDPGSADLSEAVLAEIRKLSSNKPVRFLVNTSADPALAGGNLRIGAGLTDSAQRAAIIAHENTSLRIARGGASGSAIPSDVFFRGSRELYFNDEPIEIIHAPAAYSDGDVMVFFRKSDVIVAGHVIEDLTFPVIAEGGSLQGTIDALNRILLMAVASYRSQGGTQIIPVRGRPYDEGDVAEYRDMVSILRDRIKDAIGKGRTLAQIKADRLSLDYDGRYGALPGPGSTDAFLDSAYESVAPKKATN